MPEPRLSARVKTKTEHYRADNPAGNVTANTLTAGSTGMCPGARHFIFCLVLVQPMEDLSLHH